MIDRLQQFYTDLTDESVKAFEAGKADAISGKARNAGKGALSPKRIAKDFVTSGNTTNKYLEKYNEGYTFGLQLKEGLPELKKEIETKTEKTSMEDSLSYAHQRQMMVSLSGTLEEFTNGLNQTLERYSEQVVELARAGLAKEETKKLYQDLTFLEELLKEIIGMVQTRNKSHIDTQIEKLTSLINEVGE